MGPPQLTYSTQKDPNFKRLTDSELQSRKEKGLCFKCEEKFFVGHKCKARDLKLLIVSDELEDEEMHAQEEELTTEEEPMEMERTTKLSMNMVVGFSSSGTINVKGEIVGEEAIILVDCRATHNFIFYELVERAKILMASARHFEVILGTGEAKRCKWICKEVLVRIVELTFKQDFLPLALGSIDAILGDPSLTKAEISLKKLRK